MPNIPEIFYLIIIYPIELIIGLVYKISLDLFDRPGPAILSVSTAITLLCLPLYMVAEKWQRIERDTQKKLKSKIGKIKAVFSGDEQYMILSAYYRQNHYHPMYALRSSAGLLIQVPFFIAAYNFLSNLNSLRGRSFFLIKDLFLPDGLIGVYGISVNILPIAMTLINIAAGVIYTKGFPLRDKLQLYGMAGIFLILLYKSPSDLVLYWTMNNVFSLLKNIFYKMRNPKSVLYGTGLSIILVLDCFLIFFHKGDLLNRLILVFLSLIIPFAPLIISAFRFSLRTMLKPLVEDKKARTGIFILSMFSLCLLTGFVIPSYITASSPQEFSYIDKIDTPFVFLLICFFKAFGLFFALPLSVYALFGNKKIKTLLAVSALILAAAAVINTFFFSGDYGNLSSLFTFDNGGSLKPLLQAALLNLGVMLLCCAIVFVLVKFKKIRILMVSPGIACAVFIVISVLNGFSIQKEFDRLTEIRSSQGIKVKSPEPIFHLSEKGKNVVIIMLDRAMAGFFPEILREDPELAGIYSGFVYYPNTVSFGEFTLMGVPPLYGGYEYTPEAINKRPGKALVEKHNEALLVLPRIFSSHGYVSTVTDPPWANYSWLSDLRIFGAYPEIKPVTTIKRYTDIWLNEHHFADLSVKSEVLKRNFLWLSFFKIAPLVLRDGIYDNGVWWNEDTAKADLTGLLDNYAALDYLPDLTGINNPGDSENNTFLFLQNELTHEPAFLQAPDYTPSTEISDYGKTRYSSVPGYHVNAAAIKLLGDWIKFLKQHNVYDNTRIIIAADHGRDIDLGIFGKSALPFLRERYNPLLLVKNFNAGGPLKTDNSFMTQADVPALSMEGLIANPVNPFTGNKIGRNMDNGALITTSRKWMPNEHSRNTFNISDDEWYYVHDDIFKAENWKAYKLELHDTKPALY